MQNTKNRETDVKGYWDILDSGPSPALLCFHDTRVLMHLYPYNSVSYILFYK